MILDEVRGKVGREKFSLEDVGKRCTRGYKYLDSKN
jgi:hypothetical protein